MPTPKTPPPTPEQLFAEYHALRADPAATGEMYDALAKRTRGAKASWTKLGDQARRQPCTDLQNYITRFKPAEASRLLTRESFEREVAELRASTEKRSREALAVAVRSLWRRLVETRGQRSNDPNYDDDHDELSDGEGELCTLAQELGIELEVD